MECDTNSSFMSRSTPLPVNVQRSRSKQPGERNIGTATRHPRLRRCSSLTTQGMPILTAVQSGLVSKQTLKSSPSLCEIVVSFQFPPPLSSESDREDLEDNDQTLDLNITPVFSDLTINRPRSYSTNHSLQGVAEGSKREMKKHRASAKKEENGRVSLGKEMEMSRRQSYSDADGDDDSMPTNGKTLGSIRKFRASSDEDVFLPSCGPPISNSGGMGIQNGIPPDSPDGAMKIVPDGMSTHPSTPPEKLQILHGMSPKTPVGLMMIPKGTVRPPNAMVKIPNGMAKSLLPELMKIPGCLVKSPTESMKSPNSKDNHSQGIVESTNAITKTQHCEVKTQDWLMLGSELDSRKSFQIPCPPKTPKPQQLSRSGTFRRRRVRPPPLQLQHTLANPNRDIGAAVKTPDSEQMSSSSGNYAISSTERPGNIRKKRLEELQQHEQIKSPCSPARKKFILRVSLEEIEEGN